MDEFDNMGKPQNNENGYTVTPDGGFYTKQKEDIIQDEIDTPPVYKSEETTEEKQTSEPKSAPYNPYAYSYVPPKPKEKKRYGAGIVIVAAVVAAVIGVIGASAVFMRNGVNNTAAPTPTLDTKAQNLININVDEQASSVVEAVATKVTPSVIGIRTTTSVMSFFGGSSEATGEGSGVVYTTDGYIITNYHVISDVIKKKSGSKIEVFVDTVDSDPYNATVVGYNISADIAVIKIDAKNLTPIEFADSGNLKIGQYVVTVGNPGGLEFMDSVTYGVISGLDRVVSTDSGIKLIQTDAAINPGNSGGALVNTLGQLVGINSSKIVSEQFEGMGFAIPSNTVKEITNNIIAKENSPEPYIGISISEKYTSQVLKYYGFPAGAVVLSVAEGSPAAEVGIEKGDIITEFNGTEIKEYTVLGKVLEKCKPGQKVSMKVYRSGRTYSVTLEIGSNNQVG